MLYQCKDKFVPLINEVNLVNNYIALEKIRYGKRLNLTFTHTIQDDVKIAPLLLLTFVENAFKHGISQEINVGTIDIILQADSNEINFKIENSKPKTTENTRKKKRDAIGLENINKQLEILYHKNNYILNISKEDVRYSVILKLIPNGI
jgi:LytS/YehU family sensor histidine kinase